MRAVVVVGVGLSLGLAFSGCDSAYGEHDVELFDRLATFSGSVSGIKGSAPLRVALIWKTTTGEFMACGGGAVEADGAFQVFLTRRLPDAALGALAKPPEEVPVRPGDRVARGSFLLYEDLDADGSPSLELGASASRDKLLGVSHLHVAWYSPEGWTSTKDQFQSSFALLEGPKPCFPELDCVPGSWKRPSLTLFDRPVFEGVTIEVDDKLASGSCEEELSLYGKCHQHRVELEDYLHTECPPERDGCGGNLKGETPQVPYSAWHAKPLDALESLGCCPLDLGRAPWLCNPALGCPRGYRCCDGDCDHNCATDQRQKWATIAQGQFLMGSPADEMCRGDDEQPHPVSLTRSVSFAATEVTRRQFKALMGYDPSPYDDHMDVAARYVSWHQAAAYCTELSRVSGLAQCYECTGTKGTTRCYEKAECADKKLYSCPGYRLPTEAEWEHAYRAGSTTTFYNGQITNCDQDPLADKIAWYRSNTQKPQRVGTKAPNKWGLYDMAGNVSEWVADFYSDFSQRAASTTLDPYGTPPFTRSGPQVETLRRGGSFASYADGVVAARRERCGEGGMGDQWSGFRCVRSISGTK
jgi:formylglycine-generating enzyme required for sulfatase activity